MILLHHPSSFNEKEFSRSATENVKRVPFLHMYMNREAQKTALGNKVKDFFGKTLTGKFFRICKGCQIRKAIKLTGGKQ